jgi:hypothetical protein
VGTVHEGLRVVREGLTTNDLVIVNGLMSVRPGAKVAPARDGATAAAPAVASQAKH